MIADLRHSTPYRPSAAPTLRAAVAVETPEATARAPAARLPLRRSSELRMIEQRLLSPDQAAVYLGLGSRWAIRRLIVNG